MVSSECELHGQSVQTIPEKTGIGIEERDVEWKRGDMDRGDGRRVGEWACELFAVFECLLIQCSRIEDSIDALHGVAWHGFIVECVDGYKGHN